MLSNFYNFAADDNDFCTCNFGTVSVFSSANIIIFIKISSKKIILIINISNF